MKKLLNVPTYKHGQELVIDDMLKFSLQYSPSLHENCVLFPVRVQPGKDASDAVVLPGEDRVENHECDDLIAVSVSCRESILDQFTRLVQFGSFVGYKIFKKK